MKPIVLLLLAGVVGAAGFVLLPSRPVVADNGPHGGYGATTDLCAGCHRVHTGPAPTLLEATVPALCITCHNGSGADTNVVDGLDLGTPGRGLHAGGFTNATMDSDYDGTAVAAGVTSSHTYDGSTGTAWGNGAIGSGAGATNFALSCVSCHDPHGSAGAGGTATYRILRPVPTGSGASVGVTVPDESSKVYAIASTTNQYMWEEYGAERDPLTNWCTQCHTRYNAPSGSGSTDSGDPIFAYRHITSGGVNCSVCHDWTTLPPAPSGVNKNIIHFPACTACHVAHGTSATMAGEAGSVTWPDAATLPSGNGRSSLLRLDNRGICQMCHLR